MDGKGSPLVMKLLQQFLDEKSSLGDISLKEDGSYYGFILPKGKWGQPVRFLTAAQLAEQFQVSAKTLERIRKDGSGPPYSKVGGQIRYPITELDNWIRENLMRRDSLESYGAGEDKQGV